MHPAIAEGEIAVVTGAGLGIGRAVAARLAASGMRVALLDTDAEHLHDARSEIGGETSGMLCDVSEIESLDVVRQRIADDWGGTPRVLINNAVTRIGRGMEAPLAEWHRAIDVNLFGVVNGVRAFMPGMRASGGTGMIVNLGSKQGITNPPGHPVYNMAKAAVRTYTEQLAHMLREEGSEVTAHLLVPGWTATGVEPTEAPGAWQADQVADRMLEATARGDFYIICPDNEVDETEDRRRILWGAEDVTKNRPALSRWHPEWKQRFDRGG